MARYIDEDKLIAHLKDEIKRCEIPLGSRANGKGVAYGTALGLKSAISFAETLPTADVVPKSEVVNALNEVELLIIITKEMYKQQMEDAPNELSKQSKRTKWVAFEKFYEQFAELKKKYTEGNDEKQS